MTHQTLETSFLCNRKRVKRQVVVVVVVPKRKVSKRRCKASRRSRSKTSRIITPSTRPWILIRVRLWRIQHGSRSVIESTS